MDEFQKKLEVLKLVSDFAEKEADRTWARYRMMLFIQSALALFASIEFLEKNQYVFLLVCFLGIGFGFIWYGIFVWSLYGQDRWIKDQHYIIENDDFLDAHIKGRSTERIKRPSFMHPRTLFKIPPLSFSLAWFLALVYCLYDFYRQVGTP